MINLIRTKVQDQLRVCCPAAQRNAGALHPFLRPLVSQPFVRCVALGIALCVFFNNLGAGDLYHQTMPAEMNDIIACQSVVTQFFYHSTLPIKIINACLSEFVASTGHKPLSSPERKNPAKNAAAASTAAIAQGADALLRPMIASPGKAKGMAKTFFLMSRVEEIVSIGSRWAFTRTGCFGALVVVLCGYYFGRARSSLEDHTVHNKRAYRKYSVSPNVNRVFFYASLLYITTGRSS